MNDYRIVRATEADLPTIESIARRTWPDTFGNILSTVQIEYMLSTMYSQKSLLDQLNGGHVFHLLLDAEGGHDLAYGRQASVRYRPVGYLCHEVDYEPGTTKIHKIYLLPGTQGRGFGRALIVHAEKAARKAGQQRLRLDVNYQNKAIGFYEHLGFRKLERFDTEIGNGYLMEDWRMEKEL